MVGAIGIRSAAAVVVCVAAGDVVLTSSCVLGVSVVLSLVVVVGASVVVSAADVCVSTVDWTFVQNVL